MTIIDRTIMAVVDKIVEDQKAEIAKLKREIYWLRHTLKNISNVVNSGLELSTDLSFEDTKE